MEIMRYHGNLVTARFFFFFLNIWLPGKEELTHRKSFYKEVVTSWKTGSLHQREIKDKWRVIYLLAGNHYQREVLKSGKTGNLYQLRILYHREISK